MLSKIIINDEWYWFVLSILTGLGVACLLYYRNKKTSQVPRVALISMFVLRFLSVSVILSFLLNIFFKQRRNETQNPLILLAIDNSASMVSTKDSSFLTNAFQNKINTFKTNLDVKFGVKTIFFGDQVTSDALSPTFSEKETDMASLFKDVENNYSGQNVGALVLISDGIYNKGNNPLYVSEKIGYPVYSLAMGDTTAFKDVALIKVDHNQIAYLGNNFPVEVFLNAKKFGNREITLSILANGVEKTKQTIKINTENQFSSHSFTLTASAVGLVKYTVRATVLEGEKNTVNNNLSFVMEVIDNREKILLLANRPHPDVAALKDVLINSTAYELEYGLAADFKKPLKAYSLVIFHGFVNNQNLFLQECKKSQVPFWIINPSSSDNLPGVKVAGNQGQSNEVEPIFNPSFGLFTISNGLKALIKDLPAVDAPFGNYSPTNISESLIYQRIGVVETQSPLLLFTETEGIKAGLFIGDGLWKWKFRDFEEHQNHLLFQELIDKCVQYLSVKSDKSFFRITAPKQINENEAIELGAEVYNKSYESVTDPEVTLVLADEKDKKFNYTFSKTTSAYKLNIGSLPPGEYRYAATVKYNNTLLVKKGLFLVKAVVAEKNNTVADHKLLFRISNRSGGKLFYPEQIEELERVILENDTLKPITYSQISTALLIDLQWIFWLILFLLAVEWFFRKRFLSI